MKWLELKLGRLPYVLAWHEIDSLARQSLVDTQSDLAADRDVETHFDALLGILIPNPPMDGVRTAEGG